MTTRVALLRGINVGGSGRISMARLRSILADSGATRIETLIQSGNVVFDGALTASDISYALDRAEGFRPEAVVLDAARFLAVVEGCPFPGAQADPKSLHAFFLPGPADIDLRGLAAWTGADELVAPGDGAIWLHTPGYLSRSRIAPLMDRILGLRTTARNLATLAKLADMVRRRA